jgi:prevent-host-death family protein
MSMVTKRAPVRNITAAEFKAKCLKLMDQVEATGDAIVITKRGVPIAELGPVRGKSERLVGSLKGRIEIAGNVVDSIEGVPWEALR